MKIKNTNKHYKIVNQNNSIKKTVIGGVIIFALFTSLNQDSIISKKDNENNKEQETISYTYIERDEVCRQHSNADIEALKIIKDYNFDEIFDDIYHNGKYIIDNRKYPIDSLYITILEDGSIHLVYVEENKIDILTSTEILSKKIKITSFRDSSIFYNFYNDGMFTDKELKIDSSTLKPFIDSWDGLSHSETHDLKLKEVSDKLYNERYGGKGAK